jgi:hypothetical protein
MRSRISNEVMLASVIPNGSQKSHRGGGIINSTQEIEGLILGKYLLLIRVPESLTERGRSVSDGVIGPPRSSNTLPDQSVCRYRSLK